MKYKVSELEGALLDAVVGAARGIIPEHLNPHWTPSSNWAVGGPIIERERIVFSEMTIETGSGYMAHCGKCSVSGQTHLIAAMRAYVALKYGEYVELPDER